MYTHGRLATLFALAFAASSVAPSQTPVILESPDSAVELSIAAVRAQSVQESGAQLAYGLTFRGKPVLDLSNLGLAIQGALVLGSTVRIESAKTSANDEAWNSVPGSESIQKQYNALTVQTIHAAIGIIAAD
jgi:Glycosyl-hydrolase 97 N-terminal